MKTKIFMLLICSIGLLGSAKAQRRGIIVRPYSDWGKGYLTVTDWGMVEIDNVYYSYRMADFEGPTGDGGLVLEVNGQDAKDMTPAKFYEIIDNRAENELKILYHSKEPEIVKFRTGENPKLASELQKYNLTPTDLFSKSSFDISETAVGNEHDDIQGTINELSDKEFDWFNVHTYDFLIVGNDPLTDKEILESLAIPWYMKRDTENPDILITIAKNTDESISSTYVPPTSRTVNLGSTTTAQYNYITKRNDYITTQRNQTITEGGYTQTTKNTDLFIEFTALDTKRLNDPAQTAPPIVWQMTFRRHAVNAQFDPLTEYKAIATYAAIPPGDRTAATVAGNAYTPGVQFANTGNYWKNIIHVDENSRAYRSGLRAGDEICKVVYYERTQFIYHMRLKFISTKHTEDRIYKSMVDKNLTITVKRDKKKIKLPYYLELVQFTPSITFSYWM